MSNHLKNIVYCSIIFLFLQSCSSQKSSSSANETMEEIENQGKVKPKKNNESDFSAGSTMEEAQEISESKPLNQIVIPEQEFIVERIIALEDEKVETNVSSENSSENEQLSVSNKHAKVLLFAKKLEKGAYPIAKNTLPYASVHVILTQGQEKIEGDLENGTVKLLLLDSAGITKGSFEGTLIKNNERYFIGGKFSN